MRRITFAVALALTAIPAFAAQPAARQVTPDKLTLKQVMANPDWIGHPVERPYWSADGQSIYYRQIGRASCRERARRRDPDRRHQQLRSSTHRAQIRPWR